MKKRPAYSVMWRAHGVSQAQLSWDEPVWAWLVSFINWNSVQEFQRLSLFLPTFLIFLLHDITLIIICHYNATLFHKTGNSTKVKGEVMLPKRSRGRMERILKMLNFLHLREKERAFSHVSVSWNSTKNLSLMSFY